MRSDLPMSAPAEGEAGRDIVRSVVVPVLILIAVLGVGAAYYYNSQLGKYKKNPQQFAQEEVASVVDKVKQIMILPEGEQPTLATVADPSRLKEQPFFAKAKVGDKVLLYANARKAILYDPVANKIVEVAPINIGNPTPIAPAPAPKTETKEQ